MRMLCSQHNKRLPAGPLLCMRRSRTGRCHRYWMVRGPTEIKHMAEDIKTIKVTIDNITIDVAPGEVDLVATVTVTAFGCTSIVSNAAPSGSSWVVAA